jgi:hypothetical protein
MSIKRKRVTPPNSQQMKNLQANGLYVHSSPPRGQYRSLSRSKSEDVWGSGVVTPLILNIEPRRW